MAENKNKIKLWTAIALMIHWVIYQIKPFVEDLKIEGWEVFFALLMVAGLILLATIQKRNISLPKGKKISIPKV